METLERLKEVLSIPTYFDQESRMIEYLKNVLDDKGYPYRVDDLGNIYVTKGKSTRYPCFVSHTDTVHQINENLKVIESEEDYYQMEQRSSLTLIGIDSETGKPSGIGGDDKCGVFLCLEMLDELEVAKVAFFVGEEYGMKGSKEASPQFFEDVKYSIQFDSPYGDTMSLTLCGKQLFNIRSEFGDTVSPILKEGGITEWQAHPYTDTLQLMEKFDFPCLNIAAGYYRYHTSNEYVDVGDVTNSFVLACELVKALDKDFYEVNRDSVVKDLHAINSKLNIFSP